MNINKTLFLSFIILAGGIFFLSLRETSKNNMETSPIETIEASAPEPTTNYPIVLEAKQPTGWSDLSPQIDEQGAVIVEVMPMNLNDPVNGLEFAVSLNTHSVDLSMDLSSLATLTSSNGLNLSGTTWDAPRGGHHISGLLVFDISAETLSLLNEATDLTVTITGVDAPERVFTWLK